MTFIVKVSPTPLPIDTIGLEGQTSTASAPEIAARTPGAGWAVDAAAHAAAGSVPTAILGTKVHKSSGRRFDGGISRESATGLRQALLDLARHESASRDYARRLGARGKPNGNVLCALAHRANRIAYAMVRDQVTFDPTGGGGWPFPTRGEGQADGPGRLDRPVGGLVDLHGYTDG